MCLGSFHVVVRFEIREWFGAHEDAGESWKVYTIRTWSWVVAVGFGLALVWLWLWLLSSWSFGFPSLLFFPV